MKRRTLSTALNVALSAKQRALIERMADSENKSLGEAARDLLEAGIQARGLA